MMGQDGAGVEAERSGRLAGFLSARVAEALRAAFCIDAAPEVVAAVEETLAAGGLAKPTTDARFGDYQVNVLLPLAKALRQPPRALAERFVQVFDSRGSCLAPEIAGPGFVNLRLDFKWLAGELVAAALDPRLGVLPVARPQRVVVDFSGPNVAKRMHVGHLRSTVLGDALVRTLKFLGHEVTGDNHIGDWGTQFGILLWSWKRGRDEAAFAEDPIGELERLYQAGSAAMKADPAIADACRAELAALQGGDPERRALWERFVGVSRAEAERVYARLEVAFDSWLGESFYNERLPGLVNELVEKGIAVESEGAIAIFLDEPGLPTTPFLIRKSDGAFLYATTDLATVEYRIHQLHAERLVYVVDVRQSDHFRQLFATCKKVGWEGSFVHVGFGMMLGADGRPFKTRDGGVIRLDRLLDEAEERILPVVRERWPDASADEQRKIAGKVGAGAIKYADLAQHLATDYRFDWEKLLAADGNTGPYLQYALVRSLSILREAEARFGAAFSPSDASILLDTAEERALGLELARLGDTLDRVGELLLPHILCEYLFGLARTFSAFYANCPVLASHVDAATRQSRLTLTYLVGRTLETGLSCLNIPRVTRM